MLVALVGFSTAAASSPAQADDDATVTWSVRPADGKGPDGRSWIELTVDPGDRIVEHLAVTNLSKYAVTFAIKSADGYITPAGRFNMLPAGTPSVAAGTWIDAPKAVTVSPGETKVVEFEISVPEDATPGDQPAGIAATVQSTGPGEGGAQLTLESRVGFPVMMRVTGALHPSLAIESATAEYETSWNPFQPGRLIVRYDVVNNGNVRMSADEHVESQGHAGVDTSGDSTSQLLPGDRRHVVATVSGVWPTVLVPALIELNPTVVALDGETLESPPIALDLTGWAIPWPQLIVAVAVALLGVAALWGRSRNRERVAAMIAEARDAGRREANEPARP